MTAKQIELYDFSNIDELEWPANVEGEFAKKCLAPFIKKGVQHYVDNVETKIMALKIDDVILPITINEEQYQNSFICSNYSHFVGYSLESLPDLVKNQMIRKGMEIFVRGQGKLFQMGKINKVVFVNNWPYSTTLYPEISEDKISAIKTGLQKNFPEHVIAFRTINPQINKGIFHGLKKHGFKFLASRLVYFTNTKESDLFGSRLFKSDLKLMRESGYEVLGMNEIPREQIPHLVKLYENIYLDKYSRLNPQLNKNFLELALDQGLLEIKAIRKEGSIDGVVGYFCRNGVMSCPFFGYDVNNGEKRGLYRLLSTILMLEAQKRGVIFHQGSGASFFKHVRRAKTEIEYTAFDTSHLSLARKLPWSIIKGIYNGIGVRFMRKYL